MAETDVVLRTAIALVALVNADAGVQAITGRATGNLVAWRHLAGVSARPVLAYQVDVAQEVGGLGDTREVAVHLAAFADDREDDDADVLVHRLLDRVEQLLTPAAFLALAAPLAAIVTRRVRRTVADEDPGAAARADLDLTLDVTR